MTARAVNDLATDPMMNGVCGVTARPESSAFAKTTDIGDPSILDDA